MIALALLLALACPVQDVDRWIHELGSDDPAARKAAEDRLRQAGTPVLEALKKAATDADPERNARARELVDEIGFAVRGRIAYYGSETEKKLDLGGMALFVVDPDGGPPQKVLGGIFGTYDRQWDVQWIPGRRTFLVSVDVPQEERFGLGVFPALWRVDARWRSTEKKTSPGVRTENGTGEFSLSADGARVAYIGLDAGGGSNLHVMDADGKNDRPLTRDFTKTWDPAWSPDGKKIVFVAFKGKESGTYVLAPDGTGLKRLAHDLAYPTYTPDGTAILALEHDGGYLKQPRRILTLDPATGTLVVVARSVMKNGEATWGPPCRLSPDGKRLAFVRSESCEIVLVGRDGKNEEAVATGIAPSWSPDGKRLVYQRFGDANEIWVLDLETRKDRKLAAGMYPSWSR
jgi:Tol biopolymer transport system component